MQILKFSENLFMKSFATYIFFCLLHFSTLSFYIDKVENFSFILNYLVSNLQFNKVKLYFTVTTLQEHT